jgi:type IX secretion system PorP/SprF family membrane protein
MKAMINKLKVLGIAVAALSASASQAQIQPMFTQYMFNELFINPAYAGSRDAISATGMFRTQWVGIDGAPTTQTLTVHGPAMNQKLGVGLALLNESIGVTKQTGVYANGAYRMPMKKGTLSLGLQVGMFTHIERLASVSPDVANDNQFLTNTDRVLLPNFGFGAYYKTDRWYVGLSIPRMMGNTVKLGSAGTTEVKNKLSLTSWHYFLTGGAVHQLNANLKLRGNTMIKIASAAPIEVDLTADLLIKDFIWAGLAYRSGDAASLLLGAYILPQFRLGYSYDYTLSALQRFNSGSHEIMLGYDFSLQRDKVVSPRYF